MKNLFIIAAFTLTFSASAFDIVEPNAEKLAYYQDKEYKKIEESKVPSAILTEVNTKYEGYKITDAAVSADDEYRITVAKEAKTVKVYFTATGEFVKEEK